MSNEMSDEDFEMMQNKRLTEAAVDIAGHVNIYVHRECQRKVNHGINSPFMLEDMTLAYATAMAKFSLYKVLPPEKRPLWSDMEEAAISALQVALSHVKQEIDKAEDVCQYSKH